MVLLRMCALPRKHVVHGEAGGIELGELEVCGMRFEVFFAALGEVEVTGIAVTEERLGYQSTKSQT